MMKRLMIATLSMVALLSNVYPAKTRAQAAREAAAAHRPSRGFLHQIRTHKEGIAETGVVATATTTGAILGGPAGAGVGLVLSLAVTGLYEVAKAAVKKCLNRHKPLARKEIINDDNADSDSDTEESETEEVDVPAAPKKTTKKVKKAATKAPTHHYALRTHAE